MLSTNQSKRYLLIGAVVAILLVAGAGAAFALSDNGNTYTGCLDPGGTIIHVAIGDQPAKMCAPSHTQISWNETGPAGPQGPAGPALGAASQVVVGPSNSTAVSTAVCPSGTFAVGGGCF